MLAKSLILATSWSTVNQDLSQLFACFKLSRYVSLVNNQNSPQGKITLDGHDRKTDIRDCNERLSKSYL